MKIRTAGDDMNFPSGKGMQTLNPLAGETGIGDHRIAARHHRIVESLKRRFARIGAVISGHKRPF